MPIGTGQGVYAEAVAACLSGAEVARGIALFSRRSLAHGGRAWSLADVEAPDGLRLYRATASGHWILDQSDGRAGDHRVAVRP